MIPKIIPQGSQDELVKAVGQMTTVYENRAHIKQAASPLYSRSEVEEFAPPPGMFLAHMITMGGGEQYGENRNKDFFPHEELKKHHGTFVTHARNYREHRNQDPSKAIGKIVSEKYCPDLQRGELLMWTEIDKAEKEFENARKGIEQCGSMATNVEKDVCDSCGWVSYRPTQRCDCIRNTPGKWMPDTKRYAIMINHRPIFKDYSWVSRPADRIARYIHYLFPKEDKVILSKAASEGTFHLRGDQLAEAWGYGIQDHRETLAKIAYFEGENIEDPAMQAFVNNVLPRAFEGRLDPKLVEKMAAAEPSRVMRSLTDKNVIVPIEDFHSWMNDVDPATSANDVTVIEVKENMPEVRKIIIQKLEDPDYSLAFDRAVEEFEPSGIADDSIDALMNKAVDDFSTDVCCIKKRALWFPERELYNKKASVNISPEAMGLGALYNAYLTKIANLKEKDSVKLAILSSIR